MSHPESAAPLADGLERALARVGLPAPQGLERLSGGANMESWRFAAGDEICVLRRAPSLEMMAGRPMDHAGEAALIRAARAAGVMAPEVLVELEPDECIFIDDMQINIDAANELGLHGVHFRETAQARSEVHALLRG